MVDHSALYNLTEEMKSLKQGETCTMMISILPIPICTIVNLKKGFGGRTRLATMKPITEPDMEPRTTFAGINHLRSDGLSKLRE
ncbi:hypothetical protein L484_019457 [Morus notabilis]|uniref:Uncharacterized protein n=1 Tax=Morus notabilis TaxID=981085 RepID=W9STN7_9ROSA|nr:hypothetical protein L484_019457 [Morus notabilis]